MGGLLVNKRYHIYVIISEGQTFGKMFGTGGEMVGSMFGQMLGPMFGTSGQMVQMVGQMFGQMCGTSGQMFGPMTKGPGTKGPGTKGPGPKGSEKPHVPGTAF